MGFFDKFFGSKPQPQPTERASVENAGAWGADGWDREDAANATLPIEGPPDFVRAAKMHSAYWTHDGEEQSRLAARGIGDLPWPELLRLHQLVCLERRSVSGEARQTADLLCRKTFARLSAEASPFRPRVALVWRGPQAEPGQREADITAVLSNPSLTHLGVLEFFPLDARQEPAGVQFVGFDDLWSVKFASPRIHRLAKLFYNDGRQEIVQVPILYGLTWQIGNEYDRAARMTRFLTHLTELTGGPLPGLGIGVGQQDLMAGGAMFGIGSVAQIEFVLDMEDPRFDEKARGRGLDPGRVRRHMEDRA